jgi:hypothetical protein
MPGSRLWSSAWAWRVTPTSTIGSGAMGSGSLSYRIAVWARETKDVELFPAGKGWLNAPAGMIARESECEHENGVVAPQHGTDRQRGPAFGSGTIYLYCSFCDTTWQEPLSNIKGSPWEGK